MKQIQSQNYYTFCQNHRFEGLKDYTDFNIYTENNPCHLGNRIFNQLWQQITHF